MRLSRADEIFALRALPIAALDVVVENLLELGHDGIPAQCRVKLSVYIDRGLGLFECSRPAEAEVGILGFARSVHNAAHHRKLEFFHTRIFLAPLRHRGTQVALNLFCELLEVRARGAPATRAACHLRHKAANRERLQNLLRCLHLFGAVSAGLWGKAYADRISNSAEEQRGKPSRGGDD